MTHDHHHDHDHSELTETQLRVRALETVLTEKGYVDPAALDLLIETYENKVGPRNGARVVAKAWAPLVVIPVFSPGYNFRLHRRSGRWERSQDYRGPDAVVHVPRA